MLAQEPQLCTLRARCAAAAVCPTVGRALFVLGTRAGLPGAAEGASSRAQRSGARAAALPLRPRLLLRPPRVLLQLPAPQCPPLLRRKFCDPMRRHHVCIWKPARCIWAPSLCFSHARLAEGADASSEVWRPRGPPRQLRGEAGLAVGRPVGSLGSWQRAEAALTAGSSALSVWVKGAAPFSSAHVT